MSPAHTIQISPKASLFGVCTCPTDPISVDECLLNPHHLLLIKVFLCKILRYSSLEEETVSISPLAHGSFGAFEKKMLHIFYSSTLTRWAVSNTNFILVFFQSEVTTLELQYSSLILEAAKLNFVQLYSRPVCKKCLPFSDTSYLRCHLILTDSVAADLTSD